MKRLLAPVLLLTLAVLPALAQGPDIRVPFQQITLDNGLTVLVHHDPSVPVITTNIWYLVGSAHERPGRTGFAHLFEHLMFEGSQHVPEGAIDEWFEEVGGSPNGSTSRDRTNYYQTFSRGALDLALFIESDRMGFLLPAMSPETVDGQRLVVQNERRQSFDNRPYGLAWQVIGEYLYSPDHPYFWPVIGYMDDLSAADYEDVVHFFETYYAPNNASLVIAGDVEVEEARRLAERWFGDIPAGERVPPMEAPPVTLTEQRRVMLEDRVQLPRLYMAWPTPAAFAEGDAELTAVAELLAGGKNSRLYRRMVYELQIADDVAAFQRSGKLGSEFVLLATARSDRTLDDLERVILEEMEALRQTPPETRELERIVNQYETAFFEQLESVSNKAEQLNAYAFYVGEPDYFAQDLARFQRLTPGALRAAAQRWLPAERRVVLSIVPQGQTELAASGSMPVPDEDLAVSPAAR